MDGTTMVLEADGTCTTRRDAATGPATETSTFAATWTSISFVDATGACLGEPARYDYLLSRDSLLLSRGSDDCEARRIRFDYAWTRVLESSIPAVGPGEVEAADGS